MSGVYDVTLANNNAASISASGSYLKVYAAPTGTVQVKLDGGDAYNLLEGQGIRLPEGKSFRDVAVINKSGSAQTIYLFIGDSSFEDSRIAGSVRVIDDISDAITNVDVNLALASTGGVVQIATILPAASNLRGVILRGYSVSVTNGAGGIAVIQLSAVKAAPTDYNVPTQRYVIGAQGAQGATAVNLQSIDRRINKFLPVGWGVYACWTINTAAAGAMNYSCNYELL